MEKNSDPGSGMEKVGSGIRDNHIGSATLAYRYTALTLVSLSLIRRETTEVGRLTSPNILTET
jgi:hypothetical protein